MPDSGRSDAALGMNTPIDRRDFLNSTLLASGGMLLSSIAPVELLAEEDWTGFGGVGDYSDSNGNTYEVMMAGHQIRDHVFDGTGTEPFDTGEEFDCVVVGGGISGLSAALFFARSGGGGGHALAWSSTTIPSLVARPSATSLWWRGAG